MYRNIVRSVYNDELKILRKTINQSDTVKYIRGLCKFINQRIVPIDSSAISLPPYILGKYSQSLTTERGSRSGTYKKTNKKGIVRLAERYIMNSPRLGHDIDEYIWIFPLIRKPDNWNYTSRNFNYQIIELSRNLNASRHIGSLFWILQIMFMIPFNEVEMGFSHFHSPDHITWGKIWDTLIESICLQSSRQLVSDSKIQDTNQKFLDPGELHTDNEYLGTLKKLFMKAKTNTQRSWCVMVLWCWTQKRDDVPLTAAQYITLDINKNVSISLIDRRIWEKRDSHRSLCTRSSVRTILSRTREILHFDEITTVSVHNDDPLPLDLSVYNLGWDGREITISFEIRYVFQEWQIYHIPINGRICIPSGFKDLWPPFDAKFRGDNYCELWMGKWKNVNVIGAQNWNPTYYIELRKIFSLVRWPTQVIMATGGLVDAAWGIVAYSSDNFNISSHNNMMKCRNKKTLKQYWCIQAFHSFLGFPYRWSPDQNIYMKFITTKKGVLSSIEFGMCYSPSTIPDKYYNKLKGWLDKVYIRLTESTVFTSEMKLALIYRWKDWLE